MEQNRTETLMERPFPRSTSSLEKYKRLLEVVTPEDTVGIIINADPDSMASALALNRLFWRRVKKTLVFHINVIKRKDNLAMIKLLKIKQQHIRKLNSAEISRWAILDSQPQHYDQLSKFRFDIIIDHHPVLSGSSAQFVDIRENYGANSTIMTEYLRAAKVKPSPRLATALFYGIKTDTDNFVRASTPNDINAFRYLYQFANINIIKKIESSEMSKKSLENFRKALEDLVFVKDKAFIHMGKVNDPDVLVIIADFFLKMAEATWCIVSGVYGQKLIVVFRNAGFRLDAGRTAQKLFGKWGSAGGHKSAARAEIPLQEIKPGNPDMGEFKQFVLAKIREM
ncbi:MAG: DHH family phosphoesterase [Deltaproteobacteria bacterium]|nr:DHH family phosphoesterase [Deltaproteobacteria bacterium]MBW1919544.1 DHH family phosphoesterase [Deltaproteobacteria bacterium]MBW1933997.1 DHH family phosphoesterase [Deltaproteobacteria bacterium]MBW1976584.1 DHH family phosphoesterase [Deltaproteobacteria bacterium]MBW2043256.1 DHH family phosphoesterase [Deltaproteobacteria bacterium]